MTQLRLKTVFDATRPDPTGVFEAQLLLHVASWRAHVRTAPLTVTCIGEPPGRVAAQLRESGVELEVHQTPHRLVHRSPIYNKHLSAPADGDGPGQGTGERVYLTDNDTVYLADVAALASVPDHSVAVSLADRRRVTPELWEDLRTQAGITVLPLDWVPFKEQALAERDAREPVAERYAYFNGGAILFPTGAQLWRRWEAETERLSAYLEARGLHDRKDAGSDQLSLTSAVARHGVWRLLPAGFNIRPFHFQITDLDLGDVVQLHLVNTGRALAGLGDQGSVALEDLLRRYWDRMLLVDAVPGKREVACSLLDQVLALAEDAGLAGTTLSA